MERSRVRRRGEGLMAKIWTGSITFGLVTVPATLYPATDDKSFGFNQSL